MKKFKTKDEEIAFLKGEIKALRKTISDRTNEVNSLTNGINNIHYRNQQLESELSVFRKLTDAIKSIVAK